MGAYSAVTPYRKTHVILDFPENTLREQPFSLWRNAAQIAQGHVGQAQSQNWHFLAPDALVISPWSDDPSNLHQLTDLPSSIIALSDFTAVPGMVSRNIGRAPTDLTGVTVGAGVAATGDPFIQKTVAAGTSWAQTFSADQTAFGAVTPASENVPYDRVLVGNVAYPDNQAYNLRWVLPAFAPHHKQSVGVFCFGGPIQSLQDGSIPTGQYALELKGWGHFWLYMRIQNMDNTFSFVKIDSWAATTLNTQQVINCRVWPYTSSDGTPGIQFNTELGGSQSAGGSSNLLSSYYMAGHNVSVHVWRGWNPTNPPGSGNAPLPTTGSGPPRVDHPRDQRPLMQIALIKHVGVATIFDDVYAPPFFPTPYTPFNLTWRSYAPADSSVEGFLYDAITNAELTQIGGSGPAGFKTYKLNAGHFHYYAKFVLTASSDGASPYLYGYYVTRNGVYGPNGLSGIYLPDTYPLAAVRNVSITGPDRDLTHETASMTIEDVAAQLPLLNTRARIRTRKYTEYDQNDNTKYSVLFDGYIDRADGEQKGTAGNYGLNQSGTTRLFPSPAWKEYQCTLSGMWRRLNQQLTLERFFIGGGAVNIANTCRGILGWAGFAPTEIDIPNDARTFQASTGGSDEGMLQPLATVGDTVAGFLQEYLGWLLVWDGNAGTNGMIRAIVPPPLAGPYTPLARFTLDPPAMAGAVASRPESYGSPGWYALQPGGPGGDVTIPTCFIRKRTYKTRVKPPEANVVHVTGTGLVLPNKAGQYQLNQWLFNYKSFNFWVNGDGSTKNTADPNDPDYLSECIPLVVVNTNLSTQAAVNILCRRLFDFACHAQKWVMVEAPLALVISKPDTKQQHPRPLRHYDPVVVQKGGVDYTCLVQSCNPSYRKDALQMAHYELLSVAGLF